MPEIHEFDATAQAELVRSGTVSPAELAAAAVARIEALDPGIGAIVGEPLATAGAPAAGPFAGVPLALKDAGQQLAGTHHWIGTRALHRVGWRSPATTELTARLLRLGFIPIAKTNVPELSDGATTEPAEFGPTRNPFAPDRTVGGSSGGSGAAVAAGMVAVATGGDATGSLRFPASACGVMTLKPTRGRVPSEVPAGAPDPLGVWSDFVLTRTARDLRAVFSAVTGWMPPPGGRLRVGLLYGDADPDCDAAVRRCGEALEGLGHAVAEDHPAAFARVLDPVEDDLETIDAFERACQVAWVARQVGSLEEGDLEPRTLEVATRGRALTHRDALLAARRIHAAVAPLSGWWQDDDVLVTPVMSRPPWPLGEPTVSGRAGRLCAPASFTGQPALALPIHRTAEGLPVGVQLVGALGADETLLNLACDLEESGDLYQATAASRSKKPPDGPVSSSSA